MPDREKVKKGLENLQDSIAINRMFDAHKAIGIISDVLALLKEDCHNCKLECLLQKYDELKDKYDALLKEQEETELCDRCGRRRLKSNREGGNNER